MEEPTVSFGRLASTSKDVAAKLLTIGENRMELLTVEMQEERDRFMRAFLLAIGMAVFGLMAGLTLTTAIIVLCWACSHLLVLLILTGIYGVTGLCLWWRLSKLLHDWQVLASTLEQLRKDRACLEKILA